MNTYLHTKKELARNLSNVQQRCRRLVMCLGLCVWSGWACAHHGQVCHSEAEIPASTPTNQFTVHGDGTVTDNLTGLMWQECTEGQSGVDCATGGAIDYGWDEALNLAENATTANYDDWRLPNHKELYTLVEQRCFHPAINSSVFPAGVSADPEFYNRDYWSSTIDDAYFAKSVDFATGYLGGLNRANAYGKIRLVRSGFVPQPLVAYQAFRNEFMPIARHEKCLNCHEMAKQNATWQRHVDEGRITASTDVAHDTAVCAACHTSGAGFADDWRAPASFFTAKTLLMSTTTPEDACTSINRLTDPYHHLKEDGLIVWAIEQIQQVTMHAWTDLINKMRTPNSDAFTCEPGAP